MIRGLVLYFLLCSISNTAHCSSESNESGNAELSEEELQTSIQAELNLVAGNLTEQGLTVASILAQQELQAMLISNLTAQLQEQAELIADNTVTTFTAWGSNQCPNTTTQKTLFSGIYTFLLPDNVQSCIMFYVYNDQARRKGYFPPFWRVHPPARPPNFVLRVPQSQNKVRARFSRSSF